MSVEIINPKSPALQRADGQWMKICGLLLHKLSPGKQVDITGEDIMSAPADTVVLLHEQEDRLVLKLISRAEAERIAAEDVRAVKYDPPTEPTAQ